jgi:hypothetical protein
VDRGLWTVDIWGQSLQAILLLPQFPYFCTP